MQELPLLTLVEFRNILEQCQCRWSKMADYADVDDGDPTSVLYAIERGDAADLKLAVIHIWDETLPIPHDVIRSVCTALGLGPDIFGIKN